MKVSVITSLFVGAASAWSAQGAKKPHLFLVLVDDLGWGNLGFRAGQTQFAHATTSEEVQTPNIDALVEEGLLLDRHYTYSYCSPSRSSLQTGRLPVHVVVTNDEPIVMNPADPIAGYGGAPPNMTGLAEKLRTAGYKTHMTGKWDAGMVTQEQTPLGKGYDSYFGYLHHAVNYRDETLGFKSTGTMDVCYKRGDHVVDLWHNNGPALGKNGTQYLEYMFTDNSLQVIEAHDPSEPLFLFHSFHLCHTPLDVPEEYESKFSFLKNEARRKYAAMTNMMDSQLGRLVQAFKDKGMWDDTLLVVSSDNGGPIYANVVGHKSNNLYGGANNIPLRGGKLSDFEGGIRVNAFVSGGFLPESRRGKVLENYIHITDWYATFCAIAGVDSQDPRGEAVGLPPVDSVNVLPMLLDDSAPPVRHEMHISTNTLIQGKYKLMTGSDLSIFLPELLPHGLIPKHFVPLNGYWPGWGVQAGINTMSKFKICYPACLYNIIDDPYEKEDLFHTNKDLKAVGLEMLARLEELNKSYFNPDRGQEQEDSCDVFMEDYSGFYGPFAEKLAERRSVRDIKTIDHLDALSL